MRRKGWLLGLLFLLSFAGGWLARSLFGPGGEAPPPPPADRSHLPAPIPDGREAKGLREDAASLRARVAELEAAPRVQVETARAPRPEPSGPALALNSVRIVPGSGDAARGTVRVRVLEPDGTGSAEVPVAIHRGRPNLVSRNGFSDAAGVAEFADLEPGTWGLSITLTGGQQGGGVTVLGGCVTEVAVVLPTRGVAFEGTVRDPSKGPVEGVTVTLSTMEMGFYTTLTARSDVQGRYRFDGVRPGSWNVSLSSNASATGISLSCEVFVPQGATVRKDFLSGPLLRGSVRDRSTGAPVAGARVEVQHRGSYMGRVSTDAEGGFGFKGLAPDTFMLLVSREGYGFTILRDVVVPEEGVAVEVELSTAARLRLHFTDAQGRPVVGEAILSAIVKVKGQGTDVGTNFRVDAEGKAAYDQLLPGAYTLHFTVEGVGEARIESTLQPGDNSLEVRLEGK